MSSLGTLLNAMCDLVLPYNAQWDWQEMTWHSSNGGASLSLSLRNILLVLLVF